MKCLNDNFAICLILPCDVPQTIAIYARNQLVEYLNTFICYDFYKLKNQNRIRLDIGKPEIQIGTKGSTKLSMKQLNIFELQR